VSRLWRGCSTTAVRGGSGGGAAVVTGPVAGSEDDGVSLMHPSMQAVSMCLS
jgi:hypothetical protein